MFKDKVFRQSVAAIVAATIGAGIFGVPYVMAQTGVMIGLFWIAVITFVLILENLLLGEVALRLPDNLRFLGLVRFVLKPRWARFTEIITIINFYGALIAYIFLGGKFLSTIITPFTNMPEGIARLIYVLISALIILTGFEFIEKMDELTVGLLAFLFTVLVIFALPGVHIENLKTFKLDAFFMPYGVILFALSSIHIIPTLEATLGVNKRFLRPAIITAGICGAALTAIFAIVVVGVSGTGTTSEAITGLASWLGKGIILLGAFLGLTAIIGVHGQLGNSLREIYHHDFRLPKIWAWLLVTVIPYAIVLTGFFSFIKVIGLVGGVVGGIMGIMIGWMSLRSHHLKTRKPEYCLKKDKAWAVLIIIVFALGALYEIIQIWK